ncbi:MAG: 3-hydroxyacyl-ACP dehydratase FabZ [Oscillospiraceae bacterium]|nr:3-hydroxyacyl-ACP dehydratase FabZ [Oscillospiraceae bacterium]
MNSNEIQKILPHRYPFLLLDRIDEIVEGKRAVGIKCVSANESYFQGHFPNEYVMPGVLIIEALAQVGAVIVLSIPENKGKLVYFAGIREARFKKKVIPGDVLKLEMDIIKAKGSVGFGKGTAYVNEDIVAEAELIFAIEK